MKKFNRAVISICIFAILMSACTDKSVNNLSSKSSMPDSSVEQSEESAEKPISDSIKKSSSEEQRESAGFKKVLDDGIRLQILDDVFQFPMKYEQFVEYGWVLGDEQEGIAETIRPNDDEMFWFIKDDALVWAYLENFDINSIPVSECYVSGLCMVSRDDPHVTEVAISGGAIPNKSTLEEVKEQYGKPIYEETEDGRMTIHYYGDPGQSIIFAFYPEENIATKDLLLAEVSVRNAVVPKDFVKGEVSTEIPEAVAEYKLPEKLGAGLESGTVKFDGVVYQLPVPVSVFKENGWVIENDWAIENGLVSEEDETDIVVAGHDSYPIIMKKGDQSFIDSAINYSLNATTIDNCFISELASNQFQCNKELELPLGIEIGMKESDLLKALESVEFKRYADSFLSVSYMVNPKVEPEMNARITITVSKITDKIEEIRASYFHDFGAFLEK
jgi:hypothetical protein